MAVTRLYPVKSSPYREIRYISRTDSDDRSLPRYMDSFGCRSLDAAAEDFVRTWNFWGAKGEYRCVNGFQSFQREEVSLEEAHAIGQELVRALWSDRYQVVLATHSDTDHYHNHFVINAVSLKTGESFLFDNKARKAMRETSDAICEKHHLSVIRNPSRYRRRSYTEMKAAEEGRLTLRGTIRNDIDRAIRASYTLNDCWNNLRTMGYELKLLRNDETPRKHPLLRPPGAQRFFSFHRLGESYTPEAIQKRTFRNFTIRPLTSRAAEGEIERYKAENPPPEWEENTICQIFFRYQYELKLLEGHPAYATRVSFFLRQDMVCPEHLEAETGFLRSHPIRTAENLQTERANLTEQMDALKAERVRLHREQKRNPKALDRIGEINGQLRELRKEVRICDRIADRVEDVKTELFSLLKQREEQTRKGVKLYELHR